MLYIDMDKDGQKQRLLEKLYEQAVWNNSPSIVCEKGCALCCTKSVKLTSLEAGNIISFLHKNEELHTLIRTGMPIEMSGGRGSGLPLLTNNQFARLCLEKKSAEDQISEEWNFASCRFLRDAACTIYEERPFGCRSFVSLRKCSEKGAAEVPPLFITLNTIWMQIIEHIDAGGYWGNMEDVLTVMADEKGLSEQGKKDRKEVQAASARLSQCETIPGFLVADHETARVQKMLESLFRQEISGESFADLSGIRFKELMERSTTNSR